MRQAGDERFPRWMLEFRRLASLKSQLLLHGNVNDLQLRLQADGERAAPGSLRQALVHLFQEPDLLVGYGLLGFVDLVDGLSFVELPSARVGASSESPRRIFEELLDKGRARSSDRERGSREQPELACLFDDIRVVLRNQHLPVAFVLEHASQISANPSSPGVAERAIFIRLLKMARESQAAKLDGGPKRNNLLVLVCDKLTDLPAWLYHGNPYAACVEIERPDKKQRQQFFRTFRRSFFAASASDIDRAGSDSPAAASPARLSAEKRFVELTEGMTLKDLDGLVALSRDESIPVFTESHRLEDGRLVDPIKALVELFKYGRKDNPWDQLDASGLRAIEAKLRARVKGQDDAVRATVDLLRRARAGLAGADHSSPTKPRGILFLAGPTGTGKTELAKALAEGLFGDEEACIRFDMSEYGQPHSDQRLFGAPPGYIGYEEGGQLTNRVKQRPFSVLLFDEIEKAHPSILDKFLQILEDGRMTDGRGETVYFADTILVFTSNIGAYVRDPRASAVFAGDKAALIKNIDPHREKNRRALEAKMKPVIADFFNQELGRPELLNRFGNNFVIFDFIRPRVVPEIVGKVLEGMKRQMAERRGVALEFSPDVERWIVDECSEHLEHGGRGIRNFIESEVSTRLAREEAILEAEAGSTLVVKATRAGGQVQLDVE